MQIKPMFKKYIVHSIVPYNDEYSIVLFSARLTGPGCTFIPRLKYRRILSNTLDTYSNGTTGRKELRYINDPILTRFVHFFHEKLKYGRYNFYRRLYNRVYDGFIFKILNYAKR